MSLKIMAYDTLERVKAALEKSGYGSEEIVTAKFMGWNHTDNEVHAITFLNDDSDGHMDSGCVYIDKTGKGEF